MKKTIITFILALFSICAFSQIKYELKGWQYNGVPKVNSDSTSSSYPIIVSVGIAGDTYGFINPNASKNMFNVSIPFKVYQSEEAKYAYIKEQAVTFVEENYNNK